MFRVTVPPEAAADLTGAMVQVVGPAAMADSLAVQGLAAEEATTLMVTPMVQGEPAQGVTTTRQDISAKSQSWANA